MLPWPPPPRSPGSPSGSSPDSARRSRWATGPTWSGGPFGRRRAWRTFGGGRSDSGRRCSRRPSAFWTRSSTSTPTCSPSRGRAARAPGHGPAWRQAMADLGAEPRVRHAYDVVPERLAPAGRVPLPPVRRGHRAPAAAPERGRRTSTRGAAAACGSSGGEAGSPRRREGVKGPFPLRPFPLVLRSDPPWSLPGFPTPFRPRPWGFAPRGSDDLLRSGTRGSATEGRGRMPLPALESKE